ncbi:MAG: glycosyltransferase family 2 protein [Planctomycetota bacterium]
MKFSIVTATHNSGARIEKTVRSVRAQEGVELEHLIVDNASTDDTLERIERCQSPCVRVVSEPDTGIYNAFNKGLARASGGAIAFLNADDFYLPGALARVAARFASLPGAAVVHGNIEVDSPRGPRAVRPRAGWSSFGGARVFHPATFMRREVFERVGSFDERYRIAADLDLFLRARERCAFAHLDKTLTHFALGGVSTERRFRTTAEVVAILRRHGFPLSTVLRTALSENLWNVLALLAGPFR